MKEITAAEFETEVMRAAGPVFVDCFTPECGPCRSVLPTLQEIETERAGKLKLVKVNAGAELDLAATYRITNVPTFLLFQNGVCIGQRMGEASKKSLQAWIDSTLNGK